MYAPNEYYRPYNPRTTRERPKDRQRVPPEYVAKGRGKPPSFPLLETPPPPPSLPTHSSLATSGPLLPSKDRTECHCRLSSLLKAAIFLLILLGASGGLVFWFLNHSAAQEILKDTPRNVARNVNAKVPTNVAIGTSVIEDTHEDVQNSVDVNKVAESFPAIEGELIVSPPPRIPPKGIISPGVEIIDGSTLIESVTPELAQNKDISDSKNYDDEHFTDDTKESNLDLVEVNEVYVDKNTVGNKGGIVLHEALSKNYTKEGEVQESDKVPFDEIDIRPSELSFTKDKVLDNASFSEAEKPTNAKLLTNPAENVKEIDESQSDEDNYHDFQLDTDIHMIENENSDIDEDGYGSKNENLILKVKAPIIENTEQNVEDLNVKEHEAIVTSDNDVNGSDNEEKEFFALSASFNGNSQAETLVETAQQILATSLFIESSPLFSETSHLLIELSSNLVDPTSTKSTPPHAASSTPILLPQQSSISLPDSVTSISQPIPSDSPLVTETVFGFLNFITTVRNTVMVFTQAGQDAAITTDVEAATASHLEHTADLSDFDLESSPAVPSFIQTKSSSIESNVAASIRPTAVTKTEGLGQVTGTENEVINIVQSKEEEFVEDLQDSSEEIIGSEELTEQPKKRFDNFDEKETKEKSEQESLEEERQSAEISFKERLKQRFKQFRAEHKEVLDKKVTLNSRPVTESNFGRSSNQEDDEREGKRERPKFGKRTNLIRQKLAEVLSHSKRTIEKSTLKRTFVPSFLRSESLRDPSRIQPTIARSLFEIGPASTRTPAPFQRTNRFNRPEIRRNLLDKVLGKTIDDEIVDDDKEVENIETGNTSDVENSTDIVPDISIQPSTASSDIISNVNEPTAPTFNASPSEIDANVDLQSSIQESQIVENTFVPTPLIEIVESEIKQLPSNDHQVQDTVLKQTNHESTLLVSTVLPDDLTDSYLEIATIRSPYSFNVENDQKSTRYITVTRTFTSDLLPTPSPNLLTKEQHISTLESRIYGDLDHLQSTLHVSTVFPDNIESSYLEVATIRSPYTFVLEDELKSTRFITVTRTFTSDFANIESTSIPTASAFDILDFNLDAPSFETVTETLASEEVIIKTSVVPVIVDEDFTSLQTLTQSFTVTNLVTSLKTLDASTSFSPSASFIDIDREFDNQESVNRETFLPIELGFANKNRVNIADIESEKIPTDDSFQFPDLEPSFVLNPIQTRLGQPNTISVLPTPSIPTPPLTPNSVLTKSPNVLQNLLSPEQLNYIQLLQQRLAGLKPQVVTLSEQVLRTETAYATNTIKLIQGDTEFETTLLKPIGLTTITDYKYLTTTLPPQLSSLPPVPTNLPPINPLSLVLAPSYTVVTSQVTHSTVITETETQEYKLIFRARPITTTILSTKVVSTVLTSFVTQTLTVPPIIGGFLG